MWILWKIYEISMEFCKCTLGINGGLRHSSRLVVVDLVELRRELCEDI